MSEFETLPPEPGSTRDSSSHDGVVPSRKQPSACPIHQLHELERLGGRMAPLVSWMGRCLQRFRRTSEVPEDQRPPFLASTPWFGPLWTMSHRPLDLMTEAVRRLGPVIRFEILGTPMNFVTGPEAARMARESESLGLDRKRIFQPFTLATGVRIFETEGEAHWIIRELVRLGYARCTIAPFVPKISQRVSELVHDWPQELTLLGKMEELAIESIAIGISPKRLPLDLESVGKTGIQMMRVAYRQRPGFLMHTPWSKRSRRKLYAAIDSVIQEHRAGLTQDDPMPYLMDAFMNASVGEQVLDDAAIRGFVLYAMIASYIYIGRQALFMLTEAVRDPQTYHAVQTEVDTAFSQGPLTADVLRKMPTLRALFVETNRRYPLLSGMPYETTRPVEVGGYTIGANETIFLSAVPGHFDEQHYACPWNFDPRRVRPPRNEHRAKGAYAPWGFAPHSCMAIGLSEVLSTTIVATILHTLDVTVPAPSEGISLLVDPLIAPDNGQPARVSLRDPQQRYIDPASLCEENISVRTDDSEVELPNLESQVVEAGREVVRQGEPADKFFIILEGRLSVWERSTDGDEKQVNSLGPSQAFGEIGLLKQTARTATVRAETRVELLSLDRETFLQLVLLHDDDATSLAHKIRNQYASRLLRRSLAGLPAEDLPDLGEVEFERIESGQWIVREGEPADDAYIVISGAVEVVTGIGDGQTVLGTLDKGDIFGEIGVLEQRPRTASVRSIRPTVLARLDRETLTEMIERSDVAASCLRLLAARRLMNSIEKRRPKPVGGDQVEDRPSS